MITMATFSKKMTTDMQKFKKCYRSPTHKFHKPTFIGDEYSIRTVKPVGHFDCYMISGIDKYEIENLQYIWETKKSVNEKATIICFIKLLQMCVNPNFIMCIFG